MRGARYEFERVNPTQDRWHGLATAIWARLLVTTLALPIGVLLGPNATEDSWWVLWWALLVVGALSALFALGVQLRRGLMVQTYVQMGVDLALVTAIAALTGGRESQFVPFFALRPSELRGRRIHEALPERLLPLRDLVLETLEKRTPRARAELMMRTVAGRKLPLGISTNLLMHEGDTTGVVAVFQDLTEVREMERRARRNQTLAEVGALSAGIAHELRNGLSPITGSVECLQRELKLEGENAVLMELIQRECSRLNRFVTDLLNYSRERELAPEELDLEELLAELRDQIARDPRAAAGCQVRFERRGTRVTLRVDRELVRQVWLNLASNALEAMGGAGTLTLSWEEGEGDLIVVVFSDTGVGIAPDVLAQVGQPFFTTKERGTGLGLAIAQRIVERHGGSLAIASESGRGTTVRVALPGTVAAMAHAA